MKTSKTFIHYGSTTFDTKRFKAIQNRPSFNKPFGGLWASPIDSENGWKQWNETECYAECIEENSFTFQLKPEARVYTIKSRADVYAMLERYRGKSLIPGLANIGFPIFDFEEMTKDYDAIVFFINGETYEALYGWDCDSICLFNPEAAVFSAEAPKTVETGAILLSMGVQLWEKDPEFRKEMDAAIERYRNRDFGEVSNEILKERDKKFDHMTVGYYRTRYGMIYISTSAKRGATAVVAEYEVKGAIGL